MIGVCTDNYIIGMKTVMRQIPLRTCIDNYIIAVLSKFRYKDKYSGSWLRFRWTEQYCWLCAVWHRSSIENFCS